MFLYVCPVDEVGVFVSLPGEDAYVVVLDGGVQPLH